jgi:maltose alpha-D-glucosyltransferase/alpha-amylase
VCYEWRGTAVVVVHNFSSRPQEARFRVNAEGGEHLVNLLVNDEIFAGPDGVHRVALEALGYRWYRVSGMGYALRAQRDSGAGVKW